MATWKIYVIDILPHIILSILVYGYNFQPTGPNWGYLLKNPLEWWEIMGIYGVSVFFIFKNVIPKFASFGGARRHYNDVKDPEEKGLKKFMTKSYVRLFFHILSGAIQVVFAGGYCFNPTYFNTIFSFTFLQRWFIFWDYIHEITGWLMTRGHDGIFAIRAYNLAFMVVKLFFCGQMWRMTEMNDDFITLVGGLFILTSGFAWVRFTCAIIAYAQVMLYSVDMSALRENWYSVGLWVGQYAIGWRCRVLGEYHLVFAFCAFYFPIELWKRGNKFTNLFWCCALAPAYFVEEHNHEIMCAIGVFFWVYTTWFAGTYWKRAPIPGVDYDTDIKDKEKKKKLLLRRTTFSKVLPGFLNEFVRSPSKSVRRSIAHISAYNKKFGEFQRGKSAHRYSPDDAMHKFKPAKKKTKKRKKKSKAADRKSILKKTGEKSEVRKTITFGESEYKSKTPPPGRGEIRKTLLNDDPRLPNIFLSDSESNDYAAKVQAEKMKSVMDLLKNQAGANPEDLAKQIMNLVDNTSPDSIMGDDSFDRLQKQFHQLSESFADYSRRRSTLADALSWNRNQDHY